MIRTFLLFTIAAMPGCVDPAVREARERDEAREAAVTMRAEVDARSRFDFEGGDELAARASFDFECSSRRLKGSLISEGYSRGGRRKTASVKGCDRRATYVWTESTGWVLNGGLSESRRPAAAQVRTDTGDTD